MVKKSILKRISYVAVAIVLALTAMPIAPSSNTYAAGCEQMDTSRELNDAVRESGKVTLCADISDGGKVDIRKDKVVEIDLYGHSISSNTKIEVSGDATLTISDSVGGGSYAGSLKVVRKGKLTITGGSFGGFSEADIKGELVILGGVYNSNPSIYVPEGYVVTENNGMYSVTVRPQITAADVVAPATISVKETETYNLANEIALANGVEGEIGGISLESANNGVAGVTGNVVNGVTAGNTEVTATVSVVSYGETTRVQKTIAVEVTPLFTDFVLNEEANGVITIKEGESTTLSLKSAETVDSLSDVTIDSVRLVSGGNLVSVSNRRKTVTAAPGVGVGTARIEVVAKYTHAGRTFTLTRQLDVAVKSALTGVEVRETYDYTNTGVKYDSTNGIELDINNTKDLKIVALSSAGAAVTYTVESDNPDIAEATMWYGGTNFRVNAKTPGTANITVTATPRNAVNSEGAMSVTFPVKVNALLESISADNIEIDQGQTGQIQATANDGLEPVYTYREVGFGERILNINEDGSFTARDGKHGEARVLITATKGRRMAQTVITVKVNAVLHSITLEDDEITIYEGDTAQIRIAGVDDASIRDQVSWRYSGYDHAVIGMGGTDTITPRRDGTTTVTVTGTYVSPKGNTYTATATVRVIVKSKLESITVKDINVKVGEKANFDIAVEADDVTPRYTYEYGDNTIARNSRTGGVRALKAGDTEVTVTASHFGNTVTDTAMVHVYEMEAPAHHHYYGATGQVFDVHVGDKNTNAYTLAHVDKMGMMVMGDRAVAFMPGVYTVTYTDYMANGEVVGEYTAEFTVFRVEYDTVVVARGGETKLDGHSEWSTTSAKDEVTGHHLPVNSDGKVVFVATEETALGIHNVTMKHMFRNGTREVVKEVAVIVYDVIADPESDPEGITSSTLKEYIEGMFDDVKSFEDMMERMEDARQLFGDGLEGIWSAMGVTGAVMSGSEINTRVEVTELEEADVEESMVSVVETLDVDHVEYYDVSVWMSRDGYDLGKLHQLNDKLTVALATVTDPESGYTRQYIVVRQHAGEEPEILVEGEDFIIKDGVLYVISDRFSTFAVAYKDTMIPAYGGVSFTVKAPQTGDNATEEGGVSANNIVTAVVVAVATVTLAGAVVFAKRRQ